MVHFLPKGGRLPDDVWLRRHHGLVVLLWVHVPALLVFAHYRGYSLQHSLVMCAPMAAAAGVAGISRLGRSARCVSVALGLIVGASVLVEFSGGAIEAHFHYFVVVAFLSLYQEWYPFLIAIGFVLLEHGIVGVIDPEAVYHHPAMPGMNQDPWKWALIHAGFVVAASVANLLAWRLTERESMYDRLTGLPNRALLLESLSSVHNARPGTSPAVLFLDLDNFKDTNDGFGHDYGDVLLRAIAFRLDAAGRDRDIVGRLGGDEFGVVLRDIENDGQAFAAAERFQAVFDQPFDVGGMSQLMSASIGLAVHDDNPDSDTYTPTTLLRNADLAMYDAKRAGGGHISCYHSDMHDAVLHRANLDAELRDALTRAEFVVYYQPLVSVVSGDVVGSEALIRWQHPTRGLVAPLDFIPAAEQSGFIVALGRWILRTACDQTAAWHRDHPDRRPLTVSVNLSPRQLIDTHLIDDVVEALRDSQLAPEYLCLEITEGALIKDFEAALPKLLALKTMGISLALDDFGTGYSSLSYLRRLPVDSLKIDRSFITDMTAGGEHIVAAIIDLAHTLGMSVTAEGVDSADQLTRLRAMSANVAQGYLLGRPMPHQMLTRVLADSLPSHREATPVARSKDFKLT